MSSIFSNQSIIFDHVYLESRATVAGKDEAEGPLGTYFDKVHRDYYADEKSYELGERKYLKEAVSLCLMKAHLEKEEVNIYIGADMLNQNVSINYLARELSRPTFSLYAACASFALTLGLLAQMIDTQVIQRGMSLIVSNNATAERQFRYPIEYGVQKKETMTFTATGAVASLLSATPSHIQVESFTMGKVIDLKQNNPNDMGRAMAPAAYDTLTTHFKDLNRSFDDYDLVITGDLSTYGHRILKDMLKKDYGDVENYQDCGMILYDVHEQSVFQGGSGCACSALVTMAKIVREMEEGLYHRVLIVSTGALLSPMMTFQKETIPCVAHAISLKVVEK